MGSMIEG
jgi:hypothetical protein